MNGIIKTFCTRKTEQRWFEIGLFMFVVLVWCVLMPNAHANLVPCQSQDFVQDNKLTWVWAGDSRASDGTFIALNAYKTQDGTRVNVNTANFKAPRTAERELKRWLKSATRIVEQKLVRDDSGRLVGSEVEALFSNGDRNGTYTVIAWTNEGRFFWVSSPSAALCRNVQRGISKARGLR